MDTRRMIDQTSKRLVVAIAGAALGASVLAGAASADGHDVPQSSPSELTTCFATGIDSIGRGDADGGLALWQECLAEDYTFTVTFFPGGPGFTCPGSECPIQDVDTIAEVRARVAIDEFARQGYVSTQHQMLNVHEVMHDDENATVTAYIQANHFLPDGSVDIFWGDYVIDAVRQDGAWRVQDEEIVGTSFLKFEGGPVG